MGAMLCTCPQAHGIAPMGRSYDALAYRNTRRTTSRAASVEK